MILGVRRFALLISLAVPTCLLLSLAADRWVSPSILPEGYITEIRIGERVVQREPLEYFYQGLWWAAPPPPSFNRQFNIPDTVCGFISWLPVLPPYKYYRFRPFWIKQS
jgi:hypothetical protein